MNHNQHDMHDHAMHHGMNHAMGGPKEYAKLAGVFVAIIVATGVFCSVQSIADTARIMHVFMGFFFFVFGAFKAFSWKDFVLSFRGYDVIGKRIAAYAWAYPAIELLLGILFLTDRFILQADLATLVIMAVGSVGVIQNLQHKIPCACLGSFIRLPLSKISLIEDVLMAVMALGAILFS